MSRQQSQLVDMLREELEMAGLLDLLARDDVTDVMVNEDGSVWLHAQGEEPSSVDSLQVEPDTLESILGTVASLHGTVVTADQPILEATLPIHRIRMEALHPPIVTAPVVAFRKPPGRLLTLDDLVANETMPRSVADLLAASVANRLTCVVAGGVSSGKTTLINSMLASLLGSQPDERVVILEEGARELHADGSNVTRLLTSETAGVDMTQLVRAALRLNPTRILIGEVRGPEALDWLRAANTGHPGSLLSVHANGAVKAIHRLDMLVQEAGVPSQLPRLIQAIDLVVFVARTGSRRHVHEIVQVVGQGRKREIETTTLYSAHSGGTDPRARPLPLD